MKALFLIFHGFDKANGISKKIHYQVKALKECGLDVRLCYYDISPSGERRWMADNAVIAELGQGVFAKIRKRLGLNCIANYVLRENIHFVYIRSYHNANPFTINMVKRMKKKRSKSGHGDTDFSLRSRVHHMAYEIQKAHRALFSSSPGLFP